MRETVSSYRASTGRSYQPPPWLRMRATPLGEGDSCPTLFRYPGPCGLEHLFEDRLPYLGPPDDPALWLAEQTSWTDVPGAAHFGTVAVLRPLGFAPCLTERHGVYLGLNLPREDGETAWVPPSKLGAPLPWNELARAGELGEALGDVSDERAAVRAGVRAYLDEITRLDQAGAERPRQPWCSVPEDARRELLARHGLPSVWTAS